MILLILTLILFLGVALFFFGPDILNSISVTIEDWREAFERIRERRNH